MTTEQAMELLYQAKDWGVRVVLALITFWIGVKVINFVAKRVDKLLQVRDIDPSLRGFLKTLFNAILKVALAISVITQLGVETTSFVAVFASAGLAVGMALQGSLGNFAGGVLILLFRPFKVGDYIEAQGFAGTVKEIQIFCTVLNTVDNKRIILPNGPLAGGSIINYSAESFRRVDMIFGIGYGDDIKLAKETIKQLVTADERVLKDKDITIVVGNLGDSSVDIYARAFVNTPDYWGFYWDMQEKVKLTFDEKDISIPFPQRDVHLFQEKTV